MLQKIVVVLIGLVMSLVGAFAPTSSLFASHPSPTLGLSASAQDVTLATVHSADGTAFAKVSVLWVEVDGRRVGEDAWGTGDVKELKFKVGTKDVDGLALAVGDKLIALHPTDILTVRMFNGEFSYRGIASPAATLALQGTVKTALVTQGALTQRVQTQQSLPAVQNAPQDGRLAYVVLDTGAKLDTVSVTPTSQRFYTEEATTPSAASTPGNLLARFVKIDGRLVKDYTSGDGTLDTIEFQPAVASATTGVVAFNGEPAQVDATSHVVVKDFVGEYLVYQVSDGLVRLRLDGYAADYSTMGPTATVSVPQPFGGGAPNAVFDYAPTMPTTSDTITFHDRSSDDGYVVFRQWDFGDGQTSVLQDPTHRFALPGLYEVKLNVTDNDLNQRSVTLNVAVRNSNPVPDFDFAPKIVDTSTLVAFTDHSTDIDGSITSYLWDFGDGAHANVQHPSHQYHAAGNYSVTLTTQDNLGGQASLSKVVVVRDAPPIANFDYAPSDPQTLIPVQFIDRSTDSDGTLVAWNWSFGDGGFGSGSAPTHAYPRPGIYTASLTATDNNGAKSTVSQNVVVQNRPPIPSFVWTPDGGTVDTPVIFTSTSTDPDGVILLTTWDFGDGSSSALGNPQSHTFPRHGAYDVTIHVTDGITQSALTQRVTIEDAAPHAGLLASPNPAYRDQVVLFADTSTDADGDPIVSRLWTFGDGNTSTVAFPNHTYSALGDYPITLTVRDAANKTGFASGTMSIINHPPAGSIDISPAFPIAGHPVTFTAIATDPDDPFHGSSPHNYTWRFSDTPDTFYGPVLTRNFTRGDYTVTLVMRDFEGATNSGTFRRFHVDLAPPIAAFSFSPTMPNVDAPVTFTDLSTTPNAGGIRTWSWQFGDGTTSSLANPVHSYSTGRTYTVTLSVVDAANVENNTAQDIIVNGAPTAAFTGAPANAVPAGTFVQFNDLSTDPEGEPLVYLWNFGDGATSTLRNASHTFNLPGERDVVLTVTDPHGASGVARRTVHVLDRAPIAGFTYTTPSSPYPIAGQPVVFEANGSSHDPDGDATISGWGWNFGDLGSSTVHDPTHTYANSGMYTVSLSVSDGVLTSAPATQRLRVASDHAVTVHIGARLPGARAALLNDSHYQIGVSFAPSGGNPVAYAKGQLLPVGTGYELTLPQGTWVRGDTLSVSVQDDRWMSSPLGKTLTFSDNDGRSGPVALSFDLSVPLVPTITADAGEGYLNVSGTGVGVFENDTHDAAGEPIYRSVTERFHGNGTVFYADGAPAQGANVVVEARWLPLHLVAGLRDAQLNGNPTIPNDFVIGWCRAATGGPVDAAGDYSWVFSGGDCLASSLPVMPVGVWQVRATATYSFATTGTSAHATTIVVDPTGGMMESLEGLPP